MLDPNESQDGLVMAEFGGELRAFRLTVPWLAKLEHDCEAGPAMIAGALARAVQLLDLKAEQKDLTALAMLAAGMGDWKVAYIRQALFWGLQGAGMAPNEAGRLVRTFVDERGFMGLLENVDTAFAAVTGAYLGPKDDRVGERGGAGKTAPTTRKRPSRSRTAARATR